MLAALRESLSAQRQLVADASHELRTPLTTARTGLDTLERHPELEPDERQELVGRARRELEEMTQLIDELVALARGDVRDPRNYEPVHLDEIAADLVAATASRAATTIRLHLEPTTVHGAPDDLARAINNLLDNAVKWSPEDRRRSTSPSGRLAVALRDRGPGIPRGRATHLRPLLPRRKRPHATGLRTRPRDRQASHRSTPRHRLHASCARRRKHLHDQASTHRG